MVTCRSVKQAGDSSCISLTTVNQSGDRVELFIIHANIILLGLLKSFQRKNIAFNLWSTMDNREKWDEICPKKQKNAQILLKSQSSAQKCWKRKIGFQIRKSAEEVPSAIGTGQALIARPLFRSALLSRDE